jgi:hypothetical protein
MAVMNKNCLAKGGFPESDFGGIIAYSSIRNECFRLNMACALFIKIHALSRNQERTISHVVLCGSHAIRWITPAMIAILASNIKRETNQWDKSACGIYGLSLLQW